MNLKFRFALLFTLLVGMILSVSMLIIYVLYENNRKEEFFKRVKQQAQQTFDIQYTLRNEDSLVKKITIQSSRQLTDEINVMYDSSFGVKYRFPDSVQTKADTPFLKQLMAKGEIRFVQGDRQGVGLYFPKQKLFIVSIAYNQGGLQRAQNLKLILFLVCLGAVIVTAFVSFVYARQITKPLSRLSEEIGSISESNLTQRVRVGKANDELTLIAKNFNEMLNRLEKAFNIQKSFVHHASHELRTPLASMLSQTESALRHELSIEQCKKVLESLKEDQQGLIDLTNSLLSLSQFEKIAAAGSWPNVRVDELLFDTVEASKKLFKDIHISLNFIEVPTNEEWLEIKGNETLLKSAFLNLVKNAHRYSNNRKVNLFLKATAESIVITVENTGKQIPEEERSRLFIPFFRGQNAMGKKGFGLGLSIVNRIIHLHVGTVHYEAEGEDLNRFVVEFIK